MDRFPASEDGPRYEFTSIGRVLDDLGPPEPPDLKGLIVPVVWAAISTLVLAAFIVWLLIG